MPAVLRDRPGEPGGKDAGTRGGRRRRHPQEAGIPAPAPSHGEPRDRKDADIGPGRVVGQDRAAEEKGADDRCPARHVVVVADPQEEIEPGQDEEHRRELRPGVGRILEEERVDHQDHGGHAGGGPSPEPRRQQPHGKVGEAAERRHDHLEMRIVRLRHAQERRRQNVREGRARGHLVDVDERGVPGPVPQEEPGPLPVLEPVPHPRAARVVPDEGEPCHAPAGHDQLAGHQVPGRGIGGKPPGAAPAQGEAGGGKRRQEPVPPERAAAGEDRPGDPPGHDQGEGGPRHHGFSRGQPEPAHEGQGQPERDAQDQEEAGERVGDHRRGP